MRVAASALSALLGTLMLGTMACATAGDGAIDAAPRADVRVFPDARPAIDAPVVIDAPIVDAPETPDAHAIADAAAHADAATSADAAHADASTHTPDASTHTPDAGTVTGTIASMNMSPPATGATVTISQAVIVATRISSSAGKPNRYGELFLQDQGGGLYTGAHVFCDTSPASSTPCDTAMRDLIGTLHIGDVVSVTGTYDRYMTEPPEIKVPTIAKLSQPTVTPVFTVVPAAMLADSLTAIPLSLANLYVQVAGPITVSSTAATVFASSSACAAASDGGIPLDAAAAPGYLGFEVSVGGSTLAVGLDFSPTFQYCLPDCPGTTCAAPYNVVANEKFSMLQGIASVDTFATPEYVRIDPIQDSDLPPSP